MNNKIATRSSFHLASDRNELPCPRGFYGAFTSRTPISNCPTFLGALYFGTEVYFESFTPLRYRSSWVAALAASPEMVHMASTSLIRTSLTALMLPTSERLKDSQVQRLHQTYRAPLRSGMIGGSCGFTKAKVCSTRAPRSQRASDWTETP